MKRMIVVVILAMAWSTHAAFAQSDSEIRQRIVEESIANYRATRGNCPCPYNRAANGSRCGGRSAYSRPGGASPRCHPSDVSQAEVDAYRRRNRR